MRADSTWIHTEIGIRDDGNCEHRYKDGRIDVEGKKRNEILIQYLTWTTSSLGKYHIPPHFIPIRPIPSKSFIFPMWERAQCLPSRFSSHLVGSASQSSIFSCPYDVFVSPIFPVLFSIFMLLWPTIHPSIHYTVILFSSPMTLIVNTIFLYYYYFLFTIKISKSLHTLAKPTTN